MHPLSKIAARRLREEVEDAAAQWGERRVFDSKLSALKGGAQSLIGRDVHGVDIFSDEENLYVIVDVPGYRKRRMEVTVPEKGDVEEIRVRGERRKPRNLEALVEGRSSAFDRTIVLPESCSADGVTASLENGVLTITLPRLERIKGRRIDIE